MMESLPVSNLQRKSFTVGFNDPRFSDVLLQITSSEDSSSSKPEAISESQRFDEEIHANKLLLVAQSKVFMAMFGSGMRESNQQKVKIFVDKENQSAFRDLIRFMYTGEFQSKSIDELFKILVLADQYEISDVTNSISQLLCTSSLTLETCCKYLKFVGQFEFSHSFGQLFSLCCAFLEKTFESFDDRWNSDEFLKLNHQAVELLLKSDKCKVFSENTVFQALDNWFRVKPSRAVHRKQLYQFVKFHHMTSEYLYHILQYSKDLENEAWFQGTIARALVYASANDKKKKKLKEQLGVPSARPSNSERKVVIFEWKSPTSPLKISSSSNFNVHGFLMYLQVEPKEDAIGLFVCTRTLPVCVELNCRFLVLNHTTNSYDCLRCIDNLWTNREWGWGAKELITKDKFQIYVKDDFVSVKMEVSLNEDLPSVV
eukprot:TRINITY_DN8566_c0_g1_i1.p1 TRINITY_DN8566_c0_g1~~TRINITY_DN8566_c0_g1_i1.p1  ORF type:complete len:429 (+),score=96.75 TRINITY_DN8566_c0_g1_i1:77-1363(+)